MTSPVPQDAAVAYEAALGILDELIGYAATRIDHEKRQPAPSQDEIDSWQHRRDEWARRRHDLHVADTTEIQAVLDQGGAVLWALPTD